MLTLPDFECELLQAEKRARDQFISPGLANGADALEEPSDVLECHGSEANVSKPADLCCQALRIPWRSLIFLPGA